MPTALTTALTIGNFDGAHRGHAALIRRARDHAGPDGRVVVLTFDPHPASTLRPEHAPARLTSYSRRSELLLDLGADEVRRLSPDGETLSKSPDEFIRSVCEHHRPDVIVEGRDFAFGKGRVGTIDTLRALGLEHGFRTDILDPVRVGLRDQSLVPASSTMVRWLLARGRVTDAAMVLGRPYEITGRVVRGDRRGRTIGVPTANIEPETMLPADGVYAGLAILDDGRRFPAAVNVGSRPTFAGDDRRLEAHLIGAGDARDWAPIEGLDEYGWRPRLELHAWIRDQVRFTDIHALKAQLGRDIERAAHTVQEHAHT